MRVIIRGVYIKATSVSIMRPMSSVGGDLFGIAGISVGNKLHFTMNIPN